jgi:WD40 repeat protein
VIVGSQAGLRIYSWPELLPSETRLTELANIHDLAFSPRGDVLLAAGGKPAEAGTVELRSWPQDKRICLAAAGNDVVYAVDWRADGQAFAAACGDRAVRLFDAQGELIARLDGHSQAVLTVRFLPDGKLISAGRDQSLRLWDMAARRTLRTLDNHTGAVAGLAVRPRKADSAAAWVASIGGDRTLRLWQPTIGRLVRFARLPSEPLAVEWTVDGSRVVVACADGRVRLIDLETVEIVEQHSALDGWAYTLVRAPSDSMFFAAGERGQVKRIEVASRP